jgi:uncharacterized membrane protein
MADTIGNPLSWAANSIKGTFSYLGSVSEQLSQDEAETTPEVRQISMADILDALKLGFEDFKTFRTDVIFICLLYPVVGFSLVWMVVHGSLLHLLFPVISGFALVGPLAAVSLYEMSRRREKNLETSWLALDDVLRSPTFGAIFVLGLLNVAIYIVWLIAADLIYTMILGSELPASPMAFMTEILSTKAGFLMGIIGLGVGFVFAVIVLAISVVSYPLLLDRHVGLKVAVATSVRVALKNPGPIAAWGLIIAGSLALGT